jgi:hypothetical protein
VCVDLVTLCEVFSWARQLTVCHWSATLRDPRRAVQWSNHCIGLRSDHSNGPTLQRVRGRLRRVSWLLQPTIGRARGFHLRWTPKSTGLFYHLRWKDKSTGFFYFITDHLRWSSVFTGNLRKFWCFYRDFRIKRS